MSRRVCCCRELRNRGAQRARVLRVVVVGGGVILQRRRRVGAANSQVSVKLLFAGVCRYIPGVAAAAVALQVRGAGSGPSEGGAGFAAPANSQLCLSQLFAGLSLTCAQAAACSRAAMVAASAGPAQPAGHDNTLG